MEKEFIPSKESFALRELGFCDPCLKMHFHGELKNSYGFALMMQYTNERQPEICLAPLYQQAFRWFREKHSLFPSVVTDETTYPKFAFEISVYEENYKWGKQIL